MTVLAIAQNCAARLQIPTISALVSPTDNNATLLKAMLQQTVNEIRDDFLWPELQKEYTFTLTTGTTAYALPSDYDSRLDETMWNRSSQWPLIGPINPRDWQMYLSSGLTAVNNQIFRVKGATSTQLYLLPVTTAAQNGQTAVFEDVSTNAIRPKTWIASTSWSGIRYCWYNGNYYDRGSTGAGTTGTTPPTHTSGSSSDGGITWTFTNAVYNLTHDTDEIILDNSMIEDGIVWRFKQERGLDFENLRKTALEQLEINKNKYVGSSTIYINRTNNNPYMLGLWNCPESGFG